MNFVLIFPFLYVTLFKNVYHVINYAYNVPFCNYNYKKYEDDKNQNFKKC